jgi:hypothetical protein
MAWSIHVRDITPELNESRSLVAAFKGANSSEIPGEYEDLEKEFCRLTGWPYPIEEMVFVRSWMLFRVN